MYDKCFSYGRHQEPVKSWLFGLAYHLECGYKVWLGLNDAVIISQTCHYPGSASARARRLQVASGPGCAVMTTCHTLKKLKSDSFEECYGGLCSVFRNAEVNRNMGIRGLTHRSIHSGHGFICCFTSWWHFCKRDNSRHAKAEDSYSLCSLRHVLLPCTELPPATSMEDNGPQSPSERAALKLCEQNHNCSLPGQPVVFTTQTCKSKIKFNV